MGSLIYGAARTRVPFDDRELAHLSAVLVSKLRRNERFTVSWTGHGAVGRSVLWAHSALELQFEYETSGPIELNRAWIDALLVSANRGEVRALPEPEPTPVAESG